MIFYFTGTGNTGWLANELAAATGERLVAIGAAMQHGDVHYRLEANCERVGFCFPVHGWRPPFIVRDFVRRLELQGYDESRNFTYAFATCGDDVGLTLDYLCDDLQQAGLALHSVFSVIMPETYNFPIIDQIDKPDVARRKLADASDRVQQLLPFIVDRCRGERHINASRWPHINSRLLGGYFLRHWVTDAKFSVDADACLRCGLCERVCPVGNIACPSGQVPQWLHNGLCTTCFSCYHHCPAHAIDFAGRTRGKRQYYYKKSVVEKG